MNNKVVAGVGKDAPTVENEQGGLQSKVLYRFDLLDPAAMFKMTEVLAQGAEKYGADNWRLISIQEHLNHLLIHAYAFLAGDTSDDHLSHIMCRSMFAQAVDVQTPEDVQKTREALGRNG
ncbi:dATP/dGTP diphosphohydrolase domain-containing protein [Paenibacillus sp. MMO-177]|uniref:dATP/dGTP diphosphohydrolase domain-containing protein n=1 Tax=Paenibacillus sp. MMO-177 TaxID=3081289 RepID=UPI003017F2D9